MFETDIARMIRGANGIIRVHVASGLFSFEHGGLVKSLPRATNCGRLFASHIFYGRVFV